MGLNAGVLRPEKMYFVLVKDGNAVPPEQRRRYTRSVAKRAIETAAMDLPYSTGRASGFEDRGGSVVETGGPERCQGAFYELWGVVFPGSGHNAREAVQNVLSVSPGDLMALPRTSQSTGHFRTGLETTKHFLKLHNGLSCP